MNRDDMFKDKLGVFYLPPLEPETIRKATLAACNAAKNVPEAASFLDMLGIRGLYNPKT